MRHAIAEERDAFAETGREDSERPLTAAGRRKFRRGVGGLLRIVKSIDLFATSSLARAVETGEILRKAYGIDGAERLRELAPGATPATLVRWLGRQKADAHVAIVGHEPHLSLLVAYLLTGHRAGFLELTKGGACLLGLGRAPEPGRAELRWLLTAAQLRRLGR